MISILFVLVWIGATDATSEGIFHWTDNDVISNGYTNWDPAEPNNEGDEDCVEVKSYHGRWNDEECDYKIRYVCQYPYLSIQ
jgi:hypothetical protein